MAVMKKKVTKGALLRTQKKRGVLLKKMFHASKRKTIRVEVAGESSYPPRATEVVITDEGTPFIFGADHVGDATSMRSSLVSSGTTFTKLVSPEVQRSSASGKLVIVTKEEQAERKRKAEKLGLKWYL